MLRGFHGRTFYAADSGANGTNGASQTSAGEGKNTDAPTGGQPAATSGDGKDQAGDKTSDKTFTQADVDRIVTDRLVDEKRRADAKLAKERSEAEAKQAQEQGNWQKLAEQRGTELESLKTRAEAADTYATRLNTLLESEIATWPDELKALDPGKDALESRLAWVEKSRALAQKLGALPKAADTDAGKGNHSAGSAQPVDQANDQRPAQTYRFQSSGDVKW